MNDHDVKRYLLLVCALLLAACNPAAPTETPVPPTPTTGPVVVTVGPSPTPSAPTVAPTATLIPTATPGSGALRDGELFSHQLDPGGPGIYRLNVQRGEALRVDVTPDDALDVRLVVAAPGAYEFYVDRNGPGEPETLAEFQFPFSGAYQVRVEATDGDGFIRGRADFLPTETYTGGGVFESLDAPPIEARIDAPDTFHLYRFSVEVGQIVIVQAVAESEDLDLYFHLFDPNGDIVGLYDDELSPNTPAIADLMLSLGGEYLVLVGVREGTGAYQMIVQAGG